MLLRDWKILSFLRLIVLLILSLSILSCGQSLLGPENIPPPTDFYIPPPPTLPDGSTPVVIPPKAEIEPVPAPDGVVFGGFKKRFMYQNKWHMLVENVYYYNPANKSLTQRSKYALIRLDSENNITIIKENLHNIKVVGATSYDAWDMLNDRNWNMNDTKLTYEFTSSKTGAYSAMGFEVVKGTTTHHHDDYRETTYFGDYVRRDYYIQNIYTDDLINWYYKSVIEARQNIIELPRPRKAGGSGSWQHNYGIEGADIVPFKGYIYILGGHRSWGEDNPEGRPKKEGPYSPMEKTIKRISVHNALGRHTGWEEHRAQFGERNLSQYFTRISSDRNKLFIKGAYKHRYELDDPPGIGYSWYYEGKNLDDVWSTTDGINWNPDSHANYNAAYGIDNQFTWNDALPQTPLKYKKPLPVEPLAPNWTKMKGEALFFKVDRKTYYIPIPYNELKEAANRGQTNFVITEEHLSMNAYNNFLVSKTHPDKAETKDWRALVINNYTKSSMHWLTADDDIFEINGKVIRFVDYDNTDYAYSKVFSQRDYNYSMENHRTWHARGEAGGYTSNWGYTYSQRDCYLESMNNKASADIMKLSRKYENVEQVKEIFPDVATTHYIMDFFY